MVRSSLLRTGRLGLLMCYIVGFSTAVVGAADDLERQLMKAAPDILKSLQSQGCQNVGTLKFRVKRGNDSATDRMGELNQRLADKLELALILANKVQSPIGVVRNASKTAATIPHASHLTADGRRRLFTAEYALAWGDTKVVPDVFLTGVAVISPDLRTMTVGVMSFDRSLDLVKVGQFDVKPDLEDLLDSGESFSVRGVFDGASLAKTADDRMDDATALAAKNSVLVRAETENVRRPTQSRLHPLSPHNPSALISLEALYDNHRQPIEFRDGGAFVAEPTERQKVSFRVRRAGPGRTRLGIVLKVNGENTLYRQRLPDAQCNLWVLEPNHAALDIRGFLLDSKLTQEFRVLSRAESAARELDYGEFAGTISISVFQERSGPSQLASHSILSDEAEDFAILNRCAFPLKTPATLGALKAQFSESVTRGLIVQGETMDLEVKTVQFTRDIVPALTATIRYYQPSATSP